MLGSNTEPVSHNYGACALEHGSCNYRSRQDLESTREATTMRSLHTAAREEPPLSAAREEPPLTAAGEKTPLTAAGEEPLPPQLERSPLSL